MYSKKSAAGKYLVGGGLGAKLLVAMPSIAGDKGWGLKVETPAFNGFYNFLAKIT